MRGVEDNRSGIDTEQNVKGDEPYEDQESMVFRPYDKHRRVSV